MPISAAALRLSATASNALPHTVRSKNSQTPTKTAPVQPMMKKSRGVPAKGPTEICRSPNGAGRLWGSGPKISEIDSGDPSNDMHDVKIKDSIANGRPVVIVFSTPAFCASRFCGPVNEEVEDLHDKYTDTVDFVHIEIWRDITKQVLNVTAKEWLVRPDGGMSEPYVYVIDKTGTIYNRWEGPVARNIMEQSVQAVAAGATFR